MKAITILVLFFSFSALADVKVMLESGAVWQHRNDLKIPTNNGTRVNFDEFNQGPFLHYRGELFWSLNDKHSIRALYAPFKITINGKLKESSAFNESTFDTSDPVEISYKFNSYRLSYIFSFWGQKESQLNLGITGKIRDAEIKFSQSGRSASYDNVGFVPLVYFEYQTPLIGNWLFNFNMDAAAAPQGRAIDASFKIRRNISNNFNIGLGARTLEGGADNDKVFTFSWFNYAVIDLTARF